VVALEMTMGDNPLGKRDTGNSGCTMGMACRESCSGWNSLAACSKEGLAAGLTEM
jgi:hypothetical protein